MRSMMAATLPAPADFAGISVTELPVPQPGPRQVRLAVSCASLNPVDWKIAQTGVPGWRYPQAIGIDLVGIVDEVGPGVPPDLKGERVNAMVDLRDQGTAAEYALADASAVAGVPPRMTDEDAATIPCPGITAYQLVNRSAVQADDRVLVWGADGAVGGFAAQLAARRGADVLAVSADPERMASYGANTSMTRAEVADADNMPRFSVILDCVGNPQTAQSMRWLGFGGRYAAVSQTAPVVPAFTTALSVIEVAIGAAYSSNSASAVAALGSALRWLNLQRLDPPSYDLVSLDGVGPALVGMRDDGGKAVVRVAYR